MFKPKDRVYYINLMSGAIEEARFVEYDSDGLWIRVKGQSVNTFVYSDLEKERVFPSFETAETGLNAVKSGIRARLLADNRIIDEIAAKLEEKEGKVYVSVVREILKEKF